MSAGESILVVDDDEDLRTLLTTYLNREGFRVLSAPNGASMRQALCDNDVDLIVLDVLLPDDNGFNLIRNLRRSHDTPVVLLTGKSESVDRIVGLELGADDYVCKPFELRELLARIRSILRRHARSGQPRTDEAVERVETFAGWSFDQTYRRLNSPSGAEVILTSAEFELLKMLVDSAPKPVSRDQLLKATQSRTWQPDDRSIDISVSRLRKKLEEDPKRPNLIKTVRNVGYVLTGTVTKTPRWGLS